MAAAPFVLTQGLVTAGHNYAEAAQVAGIEPQAPHVAEVTTIREHTIKGQGDFRFASSDGHTRGVVLGKLLADRLGVQPGDTIRMLAPPPGGKLMTAVGTFARPRYFQFQVTGLFETGMYEYDNSYIYMPLEVAQDFASLGPAVTGIEVRTTNRWKANEVALALEGVLGFPYRTQSWQDQNSSLFRALKLEKFAMGFIVLADRARRSVQYREHAHHGRHRQDARDRNPQGHGDARPVDPADLLEPGRGDWRRGYRDRPVDRPRGGRSCSTTTS